MAGLTKLRSRGVGTPVLILSARGNLADAGLVTLFEGEARQRERLARRSRRDQSSAYSTIDAAAAAACQASNVAATAVTTMTSLFTVRMLGLLESAVSHAR
ncbi:hypothetical protein DMB66_34820 [Actinoplanes sp. ATCC 53533]|nr:hypothetical protein DMB66_34820 [Actinoplanes sp. ATCC 53533]